MSYLNSQNKNHVIYQSLPVEIYGKPLITPGAQIMHLVGAEVPHRIMQRSMDDFVQRMPIEYAMNKSIKKHRRIKKKYLSNKIRKQNNLDKLPKTGWDYNSLETMRNMWTDYMKQCIRATDKNFDLKAPDVSDPNYMNFHTTLAKCELTGANIKVVKSNNPGYVDMEGTIVLETQQTFQIVTPRNQLKVLLKASSVFIFKVGKLEFTIFGQSLLIRPHERSIKKLKSYIKTDL